jgi:lysophospholipid acyltransferase (LPLAT)-like uncharacterized protein
MKHTPAEATRAQRAAALAGALALRALFATLRIRVADPHGFLASPPPGPVIYAFWHNRILAITAAFGRFYPPGRRGVLVLTSASSDGMWLGEVAARLGMGSVRGSSSRRGAAAMRELLEKTAAGHDIAITPDGPRGPRYHLGPGPVYLAARAGIPVIPVHARFHRCIRLRTWDGFTIPLPFARVDVTIDSAVNVPPSGGDEALEEERRKIESVLRAGAV